MTVDRNSIFDYKQSLAQISWFRECNRVATWAKLAVDVYRSRNTYEDRYWHYLFIRSASRVFETMRLRITVGWPVLEESVGNTIVPLVELLSCMVDTLEWSLKHSERECGAHSSLPWISDILQCFEVAQAMGHGRYREPLRAIPLTGDRAVRPTFIQLMRALEACVTDGLLASEEHSDDLDDLLDILQQSSRVGPPHDGADEIVSHIKYSLIMCHV